MHQTATAASYFDKMYADDPDPWRFASSAYETDKYQATIDALAGRRFHRGLEVGCSVGVLSRQLADRCTTFLGLDVAEAALVQARDRCRDRPGAEFARGAVPEDWPVAADGSPGFDLIVFSEVLYYLGTDGLRQTADRTVASLRPGGLLVLVDWLGDTGTGMTGDAAASAFIGHCGLVVQSAARTTEYRLDVLRR